MKFITLFAAVASSVSTALAALTINTPPNVVVCQPTQFTWSGGTEPYYLSLVPAGQTAAAALKTFPTQTGTSYTWTVDLGSGTSFTISLKDSTGATAYSDIVTVQGGSDNSCVNTTVTESGSASTGSTPASTSGSGSGSGSVPSSTKSSSSPTSSASGSSSSSSKSGASHVGVPVAFVAAGVMGLVGATLF